MKHNPKIVAVDLSSIVKLDNTIVTLPSVAVTPFGNFKADLEAQDSIHYAVKAGKCLPLMIGQVAPIYLSEAMSWMSHFIGGQYITMLADFLVSGTAELKKKAIEKFDRIYYAFDRVEQDLPIWEENETEVLS